MTSENQSSAFDLAHLWAQGDAISHAVAVTLLLMSVASWYLMLSKGWQFLARSRSSEATDRFWRASSLDEGLAALSGKRGDPLAADLLHHATTAAEHLRARSGSSLGNQLQADEFITRAMRQSISRSTARLESGLTVLASIGSTAPFVGLFGTVWGIYHALARISSTGMASLDAVAGPVGEALVMTAAGLFVAIPAVLAYNALTRANRLTLASLDAFAHDVHAFLSTGARLQPRTSGGAANTASGSHLATSGAA
ncbi:MAG: MotA/TolQ/ExbB proton channel family protein [Rhodocyclaceae bacterium]|nr:MotA/TolQ/ExbB proton channel family protein [Rhodocyclaceae bacterium]